MTPRIFWIGDSTVQFNNIATWPQCGMGQVLDLYVRPGIAVYDHARNGRSTKSFYDEGLWAPVEAALCPGGGVTLPTRSGNRILMSPVSTTISPG